MKKKRNLIILIAVIVLLIGAIAAVSLINTDKTEEKTEQDDNYKVLSIDQSDIASVKVESADNTVTVQNTEKGWTVNDLNEGEIDGKKAETLVGSVSTIISKNRFEAVDLGQYGLETPAITVTVTKKNGETDKVLIGDLSPTIGEYFMMLEGADNVYTLYSYKVDTLLKPVDYYKDFNRFKITVDDITEIKTEGKNGYDIKIKDKIGENFSSVWEMTSPYVSGANDDYIDNKILAAIESVSLTTPVEDNNYFDADSVKVTITVKPYDTVTGKYSDSYTEEFTVGKTVGANTYIRYKDKVFAVNNDSVSFARENPFNIVSKLQAMVDIALIKGVTVEYDGQSSTLDISKGGDGKYTFKLDGKDTDTEAAQEIYRRIIALNVDGVYNGDSMGDTVLKLTYKGIKKENDTVVEFKKIDNLNCALIRNGETVFTIQRSKTDEFKTVFTAFKDAAK